MEGKIVKAVSEFYYVKTKNNTYACKARGKFKNEDIKPLVGDDVVFQVLDFDRREGVIDEIKPRRNFLIRPAVANVDQAMVMFAVRNPTPNLSILDRFLVLMKKQNIPTIIVFNKKDLAKLDDEKNLKKIYEKSGCKVFFISAGAERRHLFWLKNALRGKITVMAGPSGVGKSTLLNNLTKDAFDDDPDQAVIGDLSARTNRGKHTTRHNQLYDPGQGFKIVDTPGFTSLLVNENDYTRDNLKEAFPEFAPYESQCPFKDCKHIKERDCAVRKAVDEGKIPTSRYNSYRSIFEDLRPSK